MPISKRSSLVGYGMAVCVVLLVTALRQLLMPVAAMIPPFNLYYLPVMMAGWYGGLRAGILATFLSAVVVVGFLHWDFGAISPNDIVRLVIFLLVGVLISILNGLRHRAQRHAEEHALHRQASQDTLHRSEARYHALVEQAADVICITDREGILTEVNAATCDLLGYSREELLGRSIYDFAHPDDFVSAPRRRQDVLEGKVVRVRRRFRHKDGSYRQFDACGKLLNEGVILIIARDITELIRGEQERENLLTSEQQARATAEALAIDNANLFEAEQGSRRMAEVAAARTARLQEITAAFSQALTTGQIAGVVVDRAIAGLGADAGFLMLVTPGGSDVELCAAAGYDENMLEGWWHIPLSGSTLPTDAIRRHGAIWIESAVAMLAAYPNTPRSPGSGKFQACGVIPLFINELPVGVIGLEFSQAQPFEREERDLVAAFARQCAQALERARLYEAEREARTEAQRAGQELRKARDMAERANRAKDHFMAVLSHELRTPLTPVLTAVQALAEDPSISLDGRNLLTIVYRNVELEARLIDDLLDLTRIEKGRVDLHRGEVDVHELIGTVLGICGSDLADRRLDIQVRLDATMHRVHADPARMQQVLWNLVKNAVKFTPDGGRISITTADHAGRLNVAVSDTGIGIEPEVLPKIFDAFEQGDRQITRQFGGLGLGLAISKVLVEMHGGTLTAASDGLGKGASFMLDLDVIIPQEAPAGAPAAGPGGYDSGGDIRILLVDDHRDTNRVVQLFLERQGYRVSTAYTMTSALEIASSSGFDLLISDIGLPDGSGLDLMRELHGREGLKGIALSGYGMEEDIRRSIEVGFAEHLIKPISPKKLQDAIERLVSSG